MPLPVIADTVRVAWLWELQLTSQRAVNVMHFQRDGEQDVADLLDAIDEEKTRAMTETAVTSADVYELQGTALDGSSPTVSKGVSGTKWTGNGGTQAVPQMAVLVKLQTGIRGPRGRGRLYLPFTAEAVQNAGQIDSAFTTEMTDAWGVFLNAMIDDHGWALGVASYAHADFHQVVNVGAETQTGTQRRRQTRNRA